MADVDEELTEEDVDGVIPTISTSRDSSAFAGAFGVAVAGAELNGLKDDRDAVAGTDGFTMVVIDWEGAEEAETDTAAWAGVTVRLEEPEVVTVATTVVVMVVVRTAAWPVLALVALNELEEDTGTSRAPATYTSVTFRACCEALVVGAVLVEVLESSAEPLVVELPLSLRTLASPHDVESSEPLSSPEELAVPDIGSIFPLEGS